MKALLTNKKAQEQQSFTINSVGSIAIMLLVAAVILGLGGTILEKIQNTQTDDNSAVINQTLTWAGNNTNIALIADTVNLGGFILYNNATIVNKGGVNGNYTLTDGGIIILNQTVGGANGEDVASWITSDLNASYNYRIGSAARNNTGFGLDGLNTMAQFIPTVSIVAAAAIIIGLMLVFFGRRKEDN